MFRQSSKLQKRVKGKMQKKWPLFHATDFKSLMYPCFIFCIIFGIFPYKINGTTFELSRSRYILSIVIVCIFSIYGLIMLYEADISGNVKMDGIPGILQANCYILFGAFITIVTYVLSSPRMRLLQTILDISKRLPPKMYQKLSRFIHAKDVIGFFFILAQSPNCLSPNVLDFLVKLFKMYVTMVVFQMDMLYMNCVCVLKACFQRINENLMNLRELMIKDEQHLLKQIYHDQKNPFLLMELNALKKQHLMVSNAVQTLNIVFSLQLLATTVMTFVEITFSMYFYINMHIYKDKYLLDMSQQIWYSYLIVSTVYYFTKMALIVWACETGKNQALEIGTTIHDVISNTSNKQIKDELQLFSLQILHRGNTFSAKGLTVDATLFSAIVGSITTYLLILIQFRNAAHSCDGRFNITKIIELEKDNKTN